MKNGDTIFYTGQINQLMETDQETIQLWRENETTAQVKVNLPNKMFCFLMIIEGIPDPEAATTSH